MSPRRAGVVVTGVLSCALACQVVAGIEEVPKVDPAAGPPDVVVEPAPADPCTHDAPPRPTRRDDAPGVKGRYYLAVREISFATSRSDGSPTGFDIDGVCRCDPRPGTRQDGGATCVGRGETSRCDGDGGVDNQFRRLGEGFDALLPGAVDDFIEVNDSISLGRRTLVVYLEGYNGTANDADVRVGMLLSNGITDPSGCPPGGPASADGTFPPQWCGNDVWTYDPETVLPGDLGTAIPKALGPGYVTDGWLVFSAERAPAYFLGVSAMEVITPRLAGRLALGDDGILRLRDATFGGRVTSSTFLENAGRVETGDPARPMCSTFDGLNVFKVVREQLCSGLDVAVNVDSVGEACGALSLGFTLSAEAAVIGGPRDAARPTLVELGCGEAIDAGLFECPP